MSDQRSVNGAAGFADSARWLIHAVTYLTPALGIYSGVLPVHPEAIDADTFPWPAISAEVELTTDGFPNFHVARSNSDCCPRPLEAQLQLQPS